MGSLILFPLMLKFVATVVKKRRNASQVKAPAAIQEKLNTLEPQLNQQTPTVIKRDELKKIYEQQKNIVKNQPEITSHWPFIVARTTVLGNYLTEHDWQDLTEQKIDEKALLERIETGFDIQVHERLANAARRVGFVNKRGQIQTGSKQAVAFSDGAGHGVKIAIDHKGESRIGADLIGFHGEECQQKQKELLTALAAEGIIVDKIKTIHHGEPDGHKAQIKSTDSSTSKQQQRRQQRGGQRVKLT